MTSTCCPLLTPMPSSDRITKFNLVNNRRLCRYLRRENIVMHGLGRERMWRSPTPPDNWPVRVYFSTVRKNDRRRLPVFPTNCLARGSSRNGHQDTAQDNSRADTILISQVNARRWLHESDGNMYSRPLRNHQLQTNPPPFIVKGCSPDKKIREHQIRFSPWIMPHNFRLLSEAPDNRLPTSEYHTATMKSWRLHVFPWNVPRIHASTTLANDVTYKFLKFAQISIGGRVYHETTSPVTSIFLFL